MLNNGVKYVREISSVYGAAICSSAMIGGGICQPLIIDGEMAAGAQSTGVVFQHVYVRKYVYSRLLTGRTHFRGVAFEGRQLGGNVFFGGILLEIIFRPRRHNGILRIVAWHEGSKGRNSAQRMAWYREEIVSISRNLRLCKFQAAQREVRLVGDGRECLLRRGVASPNGGNFNEGILCSI